MIVDNENEAPAATGCSLVSIASLSGHTDRCWTVTWNPVQPLLASCSTDKTVRMWKYTDLEAAGLGKEDSEVGFSVDNVLVTEHTRTIRSLQFAPSGRTLATASFDATIAIWDQNPHNLTEWEISSTLEGHDSECKSVGWSCDGGMLASCSRDKSVWVWEVQPDSDFECLSVLMEHTQDVKTLAWHPHEEILASASYDDTILMISDDPQSDWSPFQTIKDHDETVWALAFSPDGNYLASAGDGGVIRIHRRSGQTPEAKWVQVSILPKAHSRTIYSLSWGSGGLSSEENGLGRLASTGGDGFIRVWQVSMGPEPTSPPKIDLLVEHEDAHGVSDVNSIEWCPRKGGEDLLTTGGDDSMVRVWRVKK